MNKKVLSVPEKHQLKIAKQTLKYSDVGDSIMGGMTKDEARKFLKSIGYIDREIKKLEENSVLRQTIRKLVKEELLKEETFTIELPKSIEIDKKDFKQFISILKKNKIKYDIDLPFNENKIICNINEYFHDKDDLLRGITFEDLIIAVESNEKEIGEQSVRKVFKELLKNNMRDAEYELKSNMKQILNALKN